MTAAATQATASQINTPESVLSAYNLPASGGAGSIAIVDAYHFPTALHDFNAFAQQFGLPQESSKTVTSSNNRAFQVVYASGRKPQSGGSYIASWNLEEALDIEWAPRDRTECQDLPGRGGQLLHERSFLCGARRLHAAGRARGVNELGVAMKRIGRPPMIGFSAPRR